MSTSKRWFQFLGCCTSIVFSSTVSVYATDCSKWSQFSSSASYLMPLSVPQNKIQDHLNRLETSEGVIFDIEIKDGEVWIDVVYVPGNSTAITPLRAFLQLGRLMQGEFTNVVFADDGKRIYQIPESMARELGCQFIWGQEGGQNPIYLIRLFFENLGTFGTNERAVSGFNGSLLGDTTRAMEYHADVFLPRWVLTALE